MRQERDYQALIDGFIAFLFCLMCNQYWDYSLSSSPGTIFFTESYRNLLIYLSFYGTVPSFLVLLFPQVRTLRAYLFFASLGLFFIGFEMQVTPDLFLLPVMTLLRWLASSYERVDLSEVKKLVFHLGCFFSAVTAISVTYGFGRDESPFYSLNYIVELRKMKMGHHGPLTTLLSQIEFLLPWIMGGFFIYFLLLPVIIYKGRGLRVAFLLSVIYPVLTYYMGEVQMVAWGTLMVPGLFVLSFADEEWSYAV